MSLGPWNLSGLPRSSPTKLLCNSRPSLPLDFKSSPDAPQKFQRLSEKFPNLRRSNRTLFTKSPTDIIGGSHVGTHPKKSQSKTRGGEHENSSFPEILRRGCKRPPGPNEPKSLKSLFPCPEAVLPRRNPSVNQCKKFFPWVQQNNFWLCSLPEHTWEFGMSEFVSESDPLWQCFPHALGSLSAWMCKNRQNS